MTYYVSYNFYLRFKVEFTDNLLSIYKRRLHPKTYQTFYDETPNLSYPTNQIFCTYHETKPEYSNGLITQLFSSELASLAPRQKLQQNKEDSNSENPEYIYIADSIYKFTAKSKIVEFHSKTANYEIPESHAIDTNGNKYLFHQVFKKEILLFQPFNSNETQTVELQKIEIN